jgi:hypothetical protein
MKITHGLWHSDPFSIPDSTAEKLQCTTTHSLIDSMAGTSRVNLAGQMLQINMWGRAAIMFAQSVSWLLCAKAMLLLVQILFRSTQKPSPVVPHGCGVGRLLILPLQSHLHAASQAAGIQQGYGTAGYAGCRTSLLHGDRVLEHAYGMDGAALWEVHGLPSATKWAGLATTLPWLATQDGPLRTSCQFWCACRSGHACIKQTLCHKCQPWPETVSANGNVCVASELKPLPTSGRQC